MALSFQSRLVPLAGTSRLVTKLQHTAQRARKRRREQELTREEQPAIAGVARTLSYAEKGRAAASLRSLESALDGMEMSEIARSRRIKPTTVLAQLCECFASWDGPALQHPLFRLWTADYFRIGCEDLSAVYEALEGLEARRGGGAAAAQAEEADEEAEDWWSSDQTEARTIKQIKDQLREEISRDTVLLCLHLHRAEQGAGRRLQLPGRDGSAGQAARAVEEGQQDAQLFGAAYYAIGRGAPEVTTSKILLGETDDTRQGEARLPALESASGRTVHPGQVWVPDSQDAGPVKDTDDIGAEELDELFGEEVDS
eukprot:g72405.t1